jgi:serine/threonine protein kinase
VSLSPNSQHLIKTLESLQELENRYTQIKWVNYNAVTGEIRGVFSLVFKAFDKVNQDFVALKFFDIHPAKMFDQYRVDAFRREHEILKSLQNAHRCTQLVSAFSTYKLLIPQGSAAPLEIPCPYFAVAWIESEIDDFFERQDSYDCVEKLQLFNEIVLAVEALHRNGVHHRDIKPDNLRAYYNGSERIVVAIDLGTAARAISPPIRGDYDGGPVGAGAFAAPEAICGLAGIRQIAPFTDTYALGCLLFQLFNRDLFVREFIVKNPNYQAVLTVMGLATTGVASDNARLQAWHQVLHKHARGITPVSILVSGNTVPAGIVTLLDALVQSMTSIDYRHRPKNLENVRHRIWSAIKVVENQRIYNKRLDDAKARRDARIAKLADRKLRLQARQPRKVYDAHRSDT